VAGSQERVLRRRIKSVQSTKKITRAMELIAATRVAKAQQRATAARPYSEDLTSVMQHLAANSGVVDHPLLKPAEQVSKVAFLVISSDRGLAGGYNSSVIRAAERELQARQIEGVDYSLVLVGKKVDSYFRYRRYRVDHTFHGVSDAPTYENAVDIGSVISDLYISGEVQEVVLVFTRFISLGQQQVAVRRFLPLTGVGQETDETRATAGYEFEPAASKILESLIPRYITARVYAALLDSAASEHASRQRAMKSATDNAEDLIVKLSRVMNRARQDSITNEIMEIVGGAEALRQTQSDTSDLLVDHVFSPDPFNPVLAEAHARPDHFSSGEPS